MNTPDYLPLYSALELRDAQRELERIQVMFEGWYRQRVREGRVTRGDADRSLCLIQIAADQVKKCAMLAEVTDEMLKAAEAAKKPRREKRGQTITCKKKA